MAGSASRIINFCYNHPGTPGCTLPYKKPAPAKNCDKFPFQIGTQNGCSLYNVYYKRTELSKSDITMVNPFTNIDSGTNDAEGSLGMYIAPLYSGVYKVGMTEVVIGYVTFFAPSTVYDTVTPWKPVNNLYYNFYWIKNNTLAASICAVYNYLGKEDTIGPLWEPNSVHSFNSITCNQQLLNKSASLKAKVDSDNVVRQIAITIRK